MLTALFAIAAAVFAVMAAKWHVSCLALSKMWMDKVGRQPTDEETTAATTYVWKQIFHLK